MPIFTDLGIHIEELCEDSKKYLSRLLADRIVIGASIENSNFISWKELLDINTDNLGEDLIEYLDWRLRTNAEYVEPNDKRNLKQHIVDELIKHECQQRYQKYLESKKHQENLRSKKHAWMAIGIIIALAIAFPCALPFLGGAATLVGVFCLVTAACLIFYPIIFAFFGKSLIDSEWINQAHKEENQFLQRMKIEKEKIQANDTTIINTIDKKPLAEKKILSNKQDEEKTLVNEMHKPMKPPTAETATQTISNNKEPSVILTIECRQANSFY